MLTGVEVNFERLDDAVRARKALNGRDVLGSDVGAIRIGFAKVPVKSGSDSAEGENSAVVSTTQNVPNLSVGATIHALRNIKGASTIPSDQQVIGGAVENYRSNLLLSMIGSGMHANGASSEGQRPPNWAQAVTEQQMIMRELSDNSVDAEADIEVLAGSFILLNGNRMRAYELLSDFRPPMMYYTSIPLVSERPNNRRWDASKLRELRKRLDSGTLSVEEIDQVAGDFLDGEIVDLASDWLGNTVSNFLDKYCPRY